MDALEFLLWAMGIVLIGIPAVLIGIPCIAAIILALRLGKE